MLYLLTDYDSACRNACKDYFLQAQLPLCYWHVNKNVETAIRERWEGPAERTISLTEISKEQSNNYQYIASDKPDQKDFVEVQKDILFSETKAECKDQWEDLQQQYSHQPGLIQ